MIGLSDSFPLAFRAGAIVRYRPIDLLGAERWLGAIAIDPIDLTEVAWGWERFGTEGSTESWAEWLDRSDDSAEALQVLDDVARRGIEIDLDRRRIRFASSELLDDLLDGRTGRVSMSVDEQDRAHRVPFTIPDDWTITSCDEERNVSRSETAGSPSTANKRSECAAERRRQVEIESEVRRVLYEEVVPFGVERLVACRFAERTADGRWTPPDDFRWEQLPERSRRRSGVTPADAVAEIHARWLMTARDDLAGRSPRSWLLARRERVDSELWDRQRQWSLLLKPTTPIPRRSSVYRSASFGTHEVVLYYDLVRDLLTAGAAALLTDPTVTRGGLEAALHRRRDVWLTQPRVEDLSGEAPVDVIDRERTRLPWTIDKSGADLDCDCPFCRDLLEHDSPMFSHLDAGQLDPEWPFALTEDFRDWEDWNGEWGFPAAETAGDRIEMPRVAGDDEADEFGPIGDELGAWPLPVLLLHVACRIRDLQIEAASTDENRPLAERLRVDFATLHERALDPGWAPSAPTVTRMIETLDGWQGGDRRLRRRLDDAAAAIEMIGLRLWEFEGVPPERQESGEGNQGSSDGTVAERDRGGISAEVD